MPHLLELCPCDAQRIWPLLAAQVVYMMAETWLGKTEKTRAGSVPELVFLMAGSLLLLVWSKLSSKLKRKGNPNG